MISETGKDEYRYKILKQFTLPPPSSPKLSSRNGVETLLPIQV